MLVNGGKHDQSEGTRYNIISGSPDCLPHFAADPVTETPILWTQPAPPTEVRIYRVPIKTRAFSRDNLEIYYNFSIYNWMSVCECLVMSSCRQQVIRYANKIRSDNVLCPIYVYHIHIFFYFFLIPGAWSLYIEYSHIYQTYKHGNVISVGYAARKMHQPN